MARYQLDYDIDFPGKGSITTVAGGNGAGNGPNQLFIPTSLFIDSLNAIYISDSQNFRIQKWEKGAKQGTTVAGGNGRGRADDQLGITAGIWIDSKNNLYVADKTNGRIQRWTLGATKGETVAGGNGFGAGANQFRSPVGIYVDASGSMYIADEFNQRIQKWVLGEKSGTTVAGGRGLGNGESQIAEPSNVMLDPDGNVLVSNFYTGIVKKWFPGNPLGIPVAGNLQESETMFYANDFHLDPNGTFYMSEGNSHTVQKWMPGAKNGITLAGIGNENEKLFGPKGIFCDRDFNVYIADQFKHRVVQVLFQPQIIIPAGQLTGTMSISSINDPKLEDSEVIELLVERIEHADLASSANQVNITLLEDKDVPSSVLLGSKNKTILEENGQVAYPVRLTKKQGKKAQIQLRFSGTATLGVDYQVNKQEVIFASEDSTESILITPINNSLIEEKKSIIISVTGGTHITTPYPADTLWLLSEDQPTITQLVSNQTTLSESGGKATLQATLSKPHSRDVVITLKLEGSAHYQHDFEADFIGKGGIETAIGWLGRGNGLDQLFTPFDVKMDREDNLFIADFNNKRILKWKKGAKEGEIRVEGGKEFGIPTDFWYRTYYDFTHTSSGILLGVDQATKKNQLSPNSIFIDKKNSLYAVDLWTSSVRKWLNNASEYSVLAPAGDQDSDLNNSFVPGMMYVDNQENLYVLNKSKNQIEKWEPNASVGQPIKLKPIENHDFSKEFIAGFSFDQHGNLYVSFSNQHVVGKWDLHTGVGEIVAGKIENSGVELNLLSIPGKIFVDDQGALFILDRGNNRIQKWFAGALQGITVAGWGGPRRDQYSLSNIFGFTQDSQKNLYLHEFEKHHILKVLYQPQIIIPAGQTTGSVTFTALQDLKFEGTESIEWSIESIENAIPPQGPLENKMTIEDNDKPPLVFLENKKTRIPEEKGEYFYPVRLSNRSGKSVQIELGITGTAQLGIDYLVDKKQITFAPEDSVKWITITPLNDTIFEFKESIILSVLGGENISMPFPTDTIWIESDELPKVVAFEVDQTTISESKGKATLTATLSQVFDRDVTLILKPKGLATHFSDYDTDFLGKRTYQVAAEGLGLGYTPNETNVPWSIFLDRKNNFYVGYQFPRLIQKWPPRASKGLTVANSLGWNPNAIWVNDEENIFVMDRFQQQVVKGNINHSNYTIVAGGNGRGSNANQLSNPLDFVVDSKENVFISDNFNNRIQKWEKNAKEGKTVAKIDSPSGVALDSQGNLYVAEIQNGVVKKWEPGALNGVKVAGGNSYGKAPNQLVFPTSIFVNELGDIFINDLGNKRIQKWVAGSTVGETVLRVEDLKDVVVNQSTEFGDISVDSFGNVYVIEPRNYRVLKVIYQPQIVIPAGQKNGSLTITSKEDRTFEGDEWIEWEIDTILNATLASSIPIPKVEIKDQDTSPKVILGSPKKFLSEDNPSLHYPLRLSHKSSRIVTVQLNFSGTAELGLDYLVDKKSISFQPGDTLQTVVFSHRKDQKIDPLETIVIQVTGGEHLATPYPSDTVWIASDKEIKITSLAFEQDKITEARQQATLTATLSHIHHKDVILSFQLGGDPHYLEDYQLDFDSIDKMEIIVDGNVSRNSNNQMEFPYDFFVTPDQTLYIADKSRYNHIFKWQKGDTQGSVVAGGNTAYGAGPFDLAWQLNGPTGLVVDSLGNVFVCDYNNHRIQKFAPGSREAITVAGGNGEGNAPNQLNSPSGLFLDHQGNLWVSDKYNHRIQKFLPGSEVGITVAGGNGEGNSPNQLRYPSKIKVDQQGNLYVVDYGNHRIQRWNSGALEGITVAGGNGRGQKANQLNFPTDCWVLENGDLLIADADNKRIQKWTQGAKEGFTVPITEKLLMPRSISMDSKGNLLVLDSYRKLIFKLPFEPKLIIPAGKLSASLKFTSIDDLKTEENEMVQVEVKSIEGATIYPPWPLARLTIQDNDLPPRVLLSDSVQIILEETGTLRYPIRLSNRTTKTAKVKLDFSGTALQGMDFQVDNQEVVFSPEDSLEYLTITPLNDTDVEELKSILITVVSTENLSPLWPSDTLWISSDDKPTVTGIAWNRYTVSEANGQATLTARLAAPHSRDVYIGLKSVGAAQYGIDFKADFWGKEEVRTFVGGLGKGHAAHQLMYPTDFQSDSLGNIYVWDVGNLQISRWEPGNNLSVPAFRFLHGEWYGLGVNNMFDTTGLYLDHQNQLYFSSISQHKVHKILGEDGKTVIVAGGNGEGNAPNQLSYPKDVFVDQSGAVYVTDTGNDRVQKWASGSKEGITVAGGNGYGLAANQTAYIHKIQVDPKGNVYLLESGHDGESFKVRINMWPPGAREGIARLSYRLNYRDNISRAIDDIGDFFVNEKGDIIYTEANSGLIKKISSSAENQIEVIANLDGNQERDPEREYLRMDVDAEGNIFVLERSGNPCILKVQLAPQIVIPAGQLEGTLQLTALSDNIKEGNELARFEVTYLENGIKGVSLPKEIHIDIQDSDLLDQNPFKIISTDWVVYPNPTTRLIFLKTMGEQVKEVTIRLFESATNRQVMFKHFNEVDGNGVPIMVDSSRFKPGNYYLLIETPDNRFIKPIHVTEDN